jgi:hypothetical protein
MWLRVLGFHQWRSVMHQLHSKLVLGCYPISNHRWVFFSTKMFRTSSRRLLDCVLSFFLSYLVRFSFTIVVGSVVVGSEQTALRGLFGLVWWIRSSHEITASHFRLQTVRVYSMCSMEQSPVIYVPLWNHAGMQPSLTSKELATTDAKSWQRLTSSVTHALITLIQYVSTYWRLGEIEVIACLPLTGLGCCSSRVQLR